MPKTVNPPTPPRDSLSKELNDKSFTRSPYKTQKVLNREISGLGPLTKLKPDPTQMSAFKRFFHGTVAASFVALPEAEGCQKAALELKGSIKSQGPKLNAANIAGMGVFMAINHVEGSGSVI